MGSDDEGTKPLKVLMAKEIEGRAMSVSVAREKNPRADNKDGKNKFIHKRACCRLFIFQFL
jgi:hypothetical protein